MSLTGSVKGWTGVDGSDGASVCAVSVRTAVKAGQKPVVVSVKQLTNADSDTSPEVFRELLSNSASGYATLVTLPRTQYRLRVMPEPAVPAREMMSSLRWTVATDADTPGEDINLDWMRIPTEEQLPQRPRQIYAVITPTDALSARLITWKQFGFKPKVVDIRETALRNVAGALERPGEGLALVSADRHGVGMVFTHQGALYLDRYIDLPQDGLEATDAATRAKLYERVALQLLRSIDVVGRSFPFMPVTRVIVAPQPKPLGLLEFLSAHLPLAVEPLDLQAVFDLSRVPELAQSTELQARSLVPLGATLRGVEVDRS